MKRIKKLKLPKDPFKGLARFEISDYPFFAGRDKDIDNCIRFLKLPITKILQIHGQVGCGKSSFLRAGLAYRMQDAFDFNFIETGAYPYFGFVRKLYEFLNENRKIEILTSADEIQFAKFKYKNELRDISYEKIRKSFDLNWLNSSAYSSPEYLVNILAELDMKLITDVIFVFDQVEEIYTSSYSSDHEEINKKFFKFLAGISNCKRIKKIKFLIAMRTEYFGRLSMDIRLEDPDLFTIGDYLLSDLKYDDIVKAMLLPTSEKNIMGLGKPFDKYKFKFEENAIDKIIFNINQVRATATILPVAQVICKQLFENIERDASHNRYIAYKDYENLGGLEDHLLSYIRNCIKFEVERHSLRLQKSFEINKWEDILSRLASSHSFGISRKPMSIKEFERYAIDLRAEVDSKDMLHHLSKDNVRIVEKTNMIESDTRVSVDCITLSHDSLAYALLHRGSTLERKGRAFEREGPLGGSSGFMSGTTADELYPLIENNSCHYPIQYVQLHSLPTEIWDHKLIEFADYKGFFRRLGININFNLLKERYSELPYDKSDIILDTPDDEGLNILSLPRKLVSTERKNKSIGFAISNIFQGHAIMIFPPTKDTSFISSREERIRTLLNCYSGKNIWCEDSHFVDFAKEVRKVISMLYGEFNCIIQHYDKNTDELINKFESNKNDAAIGSAPFRAKCVRIGADPIFTPNDLIFLANKAFIEDKLKREQMRPMFDKSIIHNVWNINIPFSGWRKHLGLVMRLLSVCLFTNEYIIENNTSITDFIYSKSSSSDLAINYGLDINSIAYSFWNSYRFVRPESYYSIYYHPASDYFHQLTNAQIEIFSEYLSYKRKYELLVEELKNKIAITSSISNIPMDIFKLSEGAKLHSRILNYFDAACMMETAIKMYR